MHTIIYTTDPTGYVVMEWDHVATNQEIIDWAAEWDEITIEYDGNVNSPRRSFTLLGDSYIAAERD